MSAYMDKEKKVFANFSKNANGKFTIYNISYFYRYFKYYLMCKKKLKIICTTVVHLTATL